MVADNGLDGGPEEVATATPLTLAELRPALVAMALGPFMDHGKHPELVFRFVFELWHSYVRRLHHDESWPDTLFSVDIEDPVPTISESKASTASFACIEELGVTPPPATGWVEGEDKSQWQGNPEAPEWIYHTEDDMYWHKPSNSLWERRFVECCDPKAEAHTYYRVDAVHLQALSMFAAALDSALVPMAWKAWVRYMRKKKDRHFGLSKPPASPHKGQNSRRKDSVGGSPKSRKSQNNSSRDSRSPNQLASQDASRAGGDKGSRWLFGQGAADSAIEPPAEPAAAEPSPAEPPPEVTGNDTEAAEPLSSLDVTQSGLTNGQAAHGTVSDSWKPSLAAIPSQDILEEDKPALENEKQPMTAPPAAPEQRNEHVDEEVGKGGLLCFRCLRSRPRQRHATTARPSETAAPIRTSAVDASAAVEPKPAKNAAPAAVDWVRFNEGKDPVEVKDVPRPCIDTVERHMRRLEQFMEIVRRNPQKLVDHVERRRADKTTLAFAML